MVLNIKINKTEDAILLSGINDEYLKLIEKKFDCQIIIRGENVITNTNDLKKIEKLEIIFSKLLDLINNGNYLKTKDVLYVLNYIDDKNIIDLNNDKDNEVLFKSFTGKLIYAKTYNQKEFIYSLKEKDIIFAVGPAGCGKTYLAVTYACKLLKENKIKKIILTRPAVEAGESLGFLPGDLKEKIDPYLRPLYDTLYEMLGFETTQNYIQKGIIEVAPLAYMRGRTLENACIILDEAQNTSIRQMKMFLTRLGFQSKMIITGDITQIDLPKGVKSGLIQVCEILKGINEIDIIKFNKVDVVRNPLVKKILEKYEEYENEN